MVAGPVLTTPLPLKTRKKKKAVDFDG